MLVLPLRALSRLATFLMLCALALLGLATALFSIQGNGGALSLPALARHLQLPALRDVLRRYLHGLEAGGGIAWISVAAGAAVAVLGILLLAGLVARRRRRLVVLDDGAEGRIAAREAPLARMAAARAEAVQGVAGTRTSLRARRHGGGGKLKVTAFHAATAADDEIGRAATVALAQLSESFGLELRVHAAQRKRDGRVQ